MILATIAEQRQAWIDTMRWIAGPAFLIGVIFLAGYLISDRRFR